jgi:hypothetical protein
MSDHIAERICGDNFHLADLENELDLLTRTRGARADLERILRASLDLRPTLWPVERHARAAFVLWLLDHRKALTTVRLRHRHESKFEDRYKASGFAISRARIRSTP